MALPMAVHAIGLFPELTTPVATTNDDAQHLLFIQGASDALASGENVLDFWLPEMDQGFPEFLYYQNLPHLTVVALHRLLFGLVDVDTIFRLVRYLLLVFFPLTVFWSMRRMDFSLPAAAIGAAASSLLSTPFLYGFDYESYLWRGFGLYTQLWAMHLTFLALAAVWRMLRYGFGFRWAVLALTALGLAHLLYAYMLLVTTAVLLPFALRESIVRRTRRLAHFAIAGSLALVATAWMWLPYVLARQYLNASPYLQPEKLASFGPATILGWLVSGELTDHGRLPVLLVLLAAGAVTTVVLRQRQMLFALALFVLWLFLYFGPATLGPFGAILPLRETLLFHRFIGGVHIAAILLIGVGGAAVWRLARAEVWSPGLAIATLALGLLLAPALVERKAFEDLNTTWLVDTRDHIAADSEIASILGELRGRPGRVYAGLRTGWGDSLGFGIAFRSVHVYQYLTAQRFRTVAPPFGGASLNSDVQFDFNENDPAHYDLFDVRWVIAPRDQPMPAFLRLVRATTRYALYAAPSSGHAELVGLSSRVAVTGPASLLASNRAFLAGPGPAQREYIRYDYPAPSDGRSAARSPGCEGGGGLLAERLAPARMEFTLACASDATAVIKETYHPNWEVRVDGQRVPTFMVSPSFIGVLFPAGEHQIVAEYRSTPLKAPLLALGILVVAGTLFWPLRGQLRPGMRRWSRARDPAARGPSSDSRPNLKARTRNGRVIPAQRAHSLSHISRCAGLFALRRSGVTLPNYRRLASRVGSGIAPSRVTSALSIVCAVVALIAMADLAIRAALRLETRWDTFAYHIPFAALRAGIPIPYELNDQVQSFYDGFPPLPHLVEGILWRLSGSLNATGLAGYFAFIVFLTYCHLALRAPFWLVATISLTAPLVLIHTTVSYVDLFGNSLLAMGVSAVLLLWMFPERASRAVVCGGLAGLVGAAWSKYILVPISGVFLCLFVVVALRAATVRGSSRRPALALILLAAVIAGLPYAKNVALYGNPFWPIRIPLPVLADVAPYQIDKDAGFPQRPPPLAGEGQVSLFVHSLLEIDHPTRYSYRPRWIIDQGNAWLAFRMGGFWYVGVIAYVITTIAMLVVVRRREGVIASAGVIGTLAFVAVLPQSNELRYYMFLPLAWAAAVGMLFPGFARAFPKLAAPFLALVLGLFLYMVEENWVHYQIERVGYAEVTRDTQMSMWWSQLRPGRTYCVVGMMPIGILFTGPTMSEFTIVDRSTPDLCPRGTTIVTKNGIGGENLP